jgi:hypothetical protein
VLARKVDRAHLDFQTADALGLFDGAFDRIGDGVGRRHDAAPQPARFRLSDADHVHQTVLRRFADNAPDFACSDVETDRMYFTIYH